MHTLTFQCEVPVERTLLVKFPDSIQPGTHDVVVIIDELNAKTLPAEIPDNLMRFSGAIPSLASVDGVVLQRELREEWQ